jgi:hypothetical protein
MAIAAKRFTFLDNETNVATTDFSKADNTTILNSPNNENKSITTELAAFIKKTGPNPDIKSILKGIVGTNSSIPGRISKGASSNLLDTSSLLPKDLDKLTTSMFSGNSSASSAINQLPTTCRNKVSGMSGYGRPYDPTVNCNGNSQRSNYNSCNSSQYGNALNKITGGQYNSSYNDANSLLASLLGLSNLGYDMNMCGVFGSLSSSLGNGNTNLLSRASGAILGDLSSKGNTLGILDLANGSMGLHTKLENPGGVSNALSSFSTPSVIKEKDYSVFSDRFMGSMETFDDKWNKSSVDNSVSSRNISSNKDLSKVFKGKVMDNVYDENNLNTAPSNDFNFLSIAF